MNRLFRVTGPIRPGSNWVPPAGLRPFSKGLHFLPADSACGGFVWRPSGRGFGGNDERFSIARGDSDKYFVLILEIYVKGLIGTGVPVFHKINPLRNRYG